MTRFDRRSVLVTAGLALAHRTLAGDSWLAASPSPGSPSPGSPSSGSPLPGSSRPTSLLPGAGSTADLWPYFPSTDPEMVRAVVGAAHTDVDTVRELVTAHPALSRATVDWGFGDWESALGAAAHMGRRDIAGVLLEQGARPDIFSAAMMGQLDTVKAFIAASPGIQGIPGPHGITLLSHARAGGDSAAAVVAYLEEVGGADPHEEIVEQSAEERARYLGTYDFGTGSNDAFEVAENREVLSVKRPEQPFGRRMFYLGDGRFFPSGSPAVRIVFETEGERAVSLTVIDHEVVVVAQRRP